ncbi:hypothetical protein E2562_037943 [Oryza meyeriana var. granulata]|uniref:Uncharacterized protein n=1 Tax=Oryza meyeriana var. granulata TaxID=110450 RepID=A0A6G1ETY8_9ORYZ|nr:hypothetical protein E2562_037943 [Oryza meyeriana var. granulata]
MEPHKTRESWGLFLGLGPVKPHGELANGHLSGVGVVFVFFLAEGLRASPTLTRAAPQGRPLLLPALGLRRPLRRVADSIRWSRRRAPCVAAWQPGAAMKEAANDVDSGDSGSEGACLLASSPRAWYHPRGAGSWGPSSGAVSTDLFTIDPRDTH